MLTRLGGNFIDEWIKTQISLFLPSFAHDNIVGTSEHETVSRALMALPAIPWLRGLAKAVRGEQVGSVLQNIAAKFKTVTVKFREKKRMGSLRSLSATGFLRLLKPRKFPKAQITTLETCGLRRNTYMQT